MPPDAARGLQQQRTKNVRPLPPMKSLVITLATAALLSAGVLATGQSLNAASAGVILFASGVVAFAFADYSRRPRLALRPIPSTALRTVHAGRVARVERDSAVAALIRTASPFETMSA